jgi:hypothetical protein
VNQNKSSLLLLDFRRNFVRSDGNLTNISTYQSRSIFSFPTFPFTIEFRSFYMCFHELRITRSLATQIRPPTTSLTDNPGFSVPLLCSCLHGRTACSLTVSSLGLSYCLYNRSSCSSTSMVGDGKKDTSLF